MELESNDFASELPFGSTATRPITVADVLAASVPLHWDEAVAVLQEALGLVMSSRRDDIPAFEDLVIAPDGALTIRGVARGERGPVAAGRALHALLATADVPVALRLFVTQANAPETHASLDAFAKALAYFGKSDRAELIRAVYGRYRKVAPKPTATGKDTGEAVPPQPRPPLPAREKQRFGASPTMRNAFVVAAVIAAIAAAGAAAWLLIGGTTGDQNAASSQTAAPASVTGHAATAAAVPKARRPAVAKSAAVNATPAATLAGAPTRVADVKPPASPHTIAQPAGQAASVSRRGDHAATADPTPRSARAEATRADALHVDTPRPAQVRPPVGTEAADRRGDAIYSREDADVQPPVMMSPQLPPPLMLGTASEGAVNRMELLVAPDGSVERVRLVGAPRRMADMMLLSGAKLWKFTPAFKDGVAVRYRTMVSWTVFP